MTIELPKRGRFRLLQGEIAMLKLVSFAVAGFSLALAAPSAAATYLFELTGDYTASWEMDSNPYDPFATGGYFEIQPVLGSFPGSAFNVVILRFWTEFEGGGLTITSRLGEVPSGIVLLETVGAQLFTGDPQVAPVFAPGVFELKDFYLSQTGKYTLTISDPDAGTPAIPEPASWAMMIAGFGLVGGVLRRRRPAIA
ncbi:PEPxxWA-CTERM sorting domain-containing protein [Sandaracinobacter neustonicus]|uniref:PEPxxWA-CTERM sorting domain-containing protein n=1 Tax=Sandaracinobacter neustonicus TaxID=1715348 RepID=UPI001F177149|nr:PEPxxWA-CTERM sorting domain-containing protein [Sandaracinobacter neustonicus]